VLFRSGVFSESGDLLEAAADGILLAFATRNQNPGRIGSRMRAGQT
jgi:hypothetical protein